MIADTHAIQPAGSFRIEDMKVQDLPGIQLLQPPGWSDILPSMRLYLQNYFCHPYSVWVADEIAGTAISILPGNVAWIAGIIVQPAHRNKGIGYAITKHLLTLLEGRCSSVLLVATEYGKPVYNKLGFKEDGDYLFFSKGRINHKISPHIIPYQKKFEADLLKTDLDVTGEERQELLRLTIHNAFLFVKDNVLQGYLLAGFGEGQVIALTEEAGLALMCLNLLEEKSPVVHESNHAAIRFLREHGFVHDQTRVGTRMYLGMRVNWKPHCVYSRIGGHLG